MPDLVPMIMERRRDTDRDPGAARSNSGVDRLQPPGVGGQDAADQLAAAFADAGVEIAALEAVQVLSLEETARRLERATIPPLVSAKEFAQLCGVKVQWIYELETKRHAAEEAGEMNPFPAPVVPGYWLKTAAERFAQNRPRPGRPRKVG